MDEVQHLNALFFFFPVPQCLSFVYQFDDTRSPAKVSECLVSLGISCDAV